jgi:hypothetical protein
VKREMIHERDEASFEFWERNRVRVGEVELCQNFVDELRVRLVDFSVGSITREDDSDEGISGNGSNFKSPVEESDYFVDNIHGTAGHKAIIDPNGNDEIVGISDLMIHTRVHRALRETVVDEGIV